MIIIGHVIELWSHWQNEV